MVDDLCEERKYRKPKAEEQDQEAWKQYRNKNA